MVKFLTKNINFLELKNIEDKFMDMLIDAQKDS